VADAGLDADAPVAHALEPSSPLDGRAGLAGHALAGHTNPLDAERGQGDVVLPSLVTGGRAVSSRCQRQALESGRVMVMRVFVAGGSGVLGRRLVPQLVARGHQVTATTTSTAKLDLLADLGADGVVMDGLDAVSVGEAVAAARPEAIVHQMTAISMAHAGKPDLKHPDRWFGTTNRLRTEGTDHLLAAAEATGVTNFVAQGYASWNGIREGGWVKTEEDPLNPMVGTASQATWEAMRHLEDVVLRAGGAVLRYGAFYGPGATDDQVELVRKRQYPLVGRGTGYSSWVHLDDAASATVLAVEQKVQGVFNIVDDEPAPASEWLPYLAACAGAKPPMRIPKWLARLLAGEQAVVMMTEGRGFSNAKAKRELGWQLRYPSWRQGFQEGLA
jgi:nucleoside-diphosphate-sugar epimerase